MLSGSGPCESAVFFLFLFGRRYQRAGCGVQVFLGSPKLIMGEEE